MGLDCSHDAFHGAYSAFNRLRQFVCASTGGSFPPHWVQGPDDPQPKGTEWELERRTDIPNDCFQCGEGFPTEEWPGLYEFLTHSDCDGEISPEMCVNVADDLERLLPAMEQMKWECAGHIAAAGGFVSAVKTFIAGCRAAAAAGEPLEFC